MNKLLLIFFLLSGYFIGAQESAPIIQQNKKVLLNQEVIKDTNAIALKVFTEKFKKKYTDPAFIYEFKTPEKNALDRFLERVVLFIKNIFGLSNNVISAGIFEIVLKVLASLLVVFVIYLIVKALLNNEGQWIFGKNSNQKLINYNEIEKNLQAVDFEELISNTLKSGERRLSIRYYYLWLLKIMAQKQMIDWDIEKTNSDYQKELKNPFYKEEFAYLSYLYNYIWYGEFELDETTFSKTKVAFEKAIKSMRNE